MTDTHAPDGATDPLRALEEAAITAMREAVVSSPAPAETAFALLGAAVGHLRAVAGRDVTAAALRHLAAEVAGIG
ncbi:hypothetical protein ACFSCV_01720 [Methylopila henanensis]|uniref:Uncharacterized protein n=1 Tax=Methylopila henanensis TaxID=873516 RepID=A0ABW4K482_9HYPH